jgi:hypothetical protein
MSILRRVALLIAAAFLFAILDVIFAIICMFIHSKLWLGRIDIEAYHTAAVLVWPMLLGGLVSCSDSVGCGSGLAKIEPARSGRAIQIRHDSFATR